MEERDRDVAAGLDAADLETGQDRLPCAWPI